MEKPTWAHDIYSCKLNAEIRFKWENVYQLINSKKRHVYEFKHGGLKHKLDIKAFAHFHVKSDISSFKTMMYFIFENRVIIEHYWDYCLQLHAKIDSFILFRNKQSTTSTCVYSNNIKF